MHTEVPSSANLLRIVIHAIIEGASHVDGCFFSPTETPCKKTKSKKDVKLQNLEATNHVQQCNALKSYR